MLIDQPFFIKISIIYIGLKNSISILIDTHIEILPFFSIHSF